MKTVVALLLACAVAAPAFAADASAPKDMKQMEKQHKPMHKKQMHMKKKASAA
ncbi:MULTISPECIES: hypothetical protein [unclassified Paludibacterium]|uniref:hypothetical protein n=1 Tax=unclassified Paludibacterium TaxID=2618429 RepID=UPI001C05B359|nr:hypothetical protein [Paludibacterium sp. B53371]BEV73499.1 hypothetical protein THUN1379_29810 [Paludibacterium sp. THUN1379]